MIFCPDDLSIVESGILKCPTITVLLSISQYLLEIFVVVQSLSHVQLFVTPWIAALQASLSFTISQSLLKFMSIESVIPSHSLLPPSPVALNLSQHQSLLQ